MRIIDNLRAPFAVLAGAGISYAAPSSLPSVADFIASILTRVPLDAEDRDELIAATGSSWKAGIGYFHMLRFEQFVEALQLTVDQELCSLVAALPNTVPSDYHHMLAGLLERGFPVITTNFDTLIESACSTLGISCSIVESEKDYAMYLRNGPASFPKPLFKLHGTLRPSEYGALRCLNTCISDVATQSVTATNKWQVIQTLLKRHDLLVVGYSGNDDYDVMPAIKYSPGSRRLCWITHCQGPATRVLRGLHDPGSILSGQDRKLAWFFNRMFLSFDFQNGSVSRKPEETVILEGNTAALLREFIDDLGISVPESLSRGEPQKLDPGVLGSAFENEDRASVLLAGRLEQIIGRYKKALAYMHSFLSQSHASQILTARAHLWIAQMSHEQGRPYSALGHFRQAFVLLQGVGQLHWSDISALQEIAVYSQNESWIANSFLAQQAKAGFVGPDDSRERLCNTWLLGRQIIFDVERALSANDVDRARESLETLRTRDFDLDRELLADVMYWQAVLQSSDDPGRVEDRTRHRHVDDEAEDLATRAALVYEDLQLRYKQIAALILAAEQNLPSWPDIGYKQAWQAARICQFIGDDASAAYAFKLQAQFAEILFCHGSDLNEAFLTKPETLWRFASECESRFEIAKHAQCCPIPNFSIDTAL